MRGALLGVTCAVIGFAGGLLLAGPVGGVIGAVAGGLAGTAAALLQMRAAVAITLVASLAVGAVIGQGIVHALCLPDGCGAAEAVGAIVMGIGAFVAVGLVAALVTRSFEEYHEAVAARRPPPGPGCETDEVREEA